MNPFQQLHNSAELARQQELASTHSQNEHVDIGFQQSANMPPPGPQASPGRPCNAPRMSPLPPMPATPTATFQPNPQMGSASLYPVVHPHQAPAPIHNGFGGAQHYPVGSGMPHVSAPAHQPQWGQAMVRCPSPQSFFPYQTHGGPHYPPWHQISSGQQSYMVHQTPAYAQQQNDDHQQPWSQAIYPIGPYVAQPIPAFTHRPLWHQVDNGQPRSQPHVPNQTSGLAGPSPSNSQTVQSPVQQRSESQQPLSNTVMVKSDPNQQSSRQGPSLLNVPHIRQPSGTQTRQASGTQTRQASGTQTPQPSGRDGAGPQQPQSSTVTVNRETDQSSADPTQSHTSTTATASTVPVITSGLIQPPNALIRPLPRDALLMKVFGFYGKTERSMLNELNNKYHDVLEDQDIPAEKRAETERELLLHGQHVYRAYRQFYYTSLPATHRALFNIQYSRDPAVLRAAKKKLKEHKDIWFPHGWPYLCRCVVAIAQKRAGVNYDTELDPAWVDGPARVWDERNIPSSDWQLWEGYLKIV